MIPICLAMSNKDKSPRFLLLLEMIDHPREESIGGTFVEMPVPIIFYIF